jgi:large subunit ribosomal protein L9
MKVILLENVKNVGSKYDVKDVSGGYARNFLFPNKLAKPATPGSLKELEALKSRFNKEETELKKHLEESARKMKETALEFYLKTDEEGSVFGSITKEAILKGMRDTGLTTKERVEIVLDHPIKELGERKLLVRLKKGVESEIKIIVRPE